jgi:hypothetical protein
VQRAPRPRRLTSDRDPSPLTRRRSPLISMCMTHLDFESRLASQPDLVWLVVSTMTGVNDERFPWMRMTVPGGRENLVDIDQCPHRCEDAELKERPTQTCQHPAVRTDGVGLTGNAPPGCTWKWR